MKQVEIFTNGVFEVKVREVNGQFEFDTESAAKSLGFTDIKNGKVYVRWNTVNKYLASFGFSQEVAKGDFIPEQFLYLLAMKANNENAVRFQMWLATEVLPAIRKKGYYIADTITTEQTGELNKEVKYLPANLKQTFLNAVPTTDNLRQMINDCLNMYKGRQYDKTKNGSLYKKKMYCEILKALNQMLDEHKTKGNEGEVRTLDNMIKWILEEEKESIKQTKYSKVYYRDCLIEKLQQENQRLKVHSESIVEVIEDEEGRERITGIYCIESIRDRKKYVGMSKDIHMRWAQHRADLRGNIHHNANLQASWNRYGEDNFEFVVLEECGENELREKERQWIHELKEHAYNMNCKAC